MAVQKVFPRQNDVRDYFNGLTALTIYTDPQGKNLASIFTYPANVAIPGAVIYTDTTGAITQFYGSTAGEGVLYAKPSTASPSSPLIQLTGENAVGLSLPQEYGRSGVVKGTAGSAADGQTLHQWTGKVVLSTTANTTVHLPVGVSADYTVTQGSTFYVTDLYASGNTSNQFEVMVVDNATPPVNVFYGIAKGDTAPIEISGFETQPQVNGGDVMTLVFGPAATVTTAYYFLSGFEQATYPAPVLN